jgi:hypothetical protein
VKVPLDTSQADAQTFVERNQGNPQGPQSLSLRSYFLELQFRGTCGVLVDRRRHGPASDIGKETIVALRPDQRTSANRRMQMPAEGEQL